MYVINACYQEGGKERGGFQPNLMSIWTKIGPIKNHCLLIVI